MFTLAQVLKVLDHVLFLHPTEQVLIILKVPSLSSHSLVHVPADSVREL